MKRIDHRLPIPSIHASEDFLTSLNEYSIDNLENPNKAVITKCIIMAYLTDNGIRLMEIHPIDQQTINIFKRAAILESENAGEITDEELSLLGLRHA